jgi:hypothetical protein
MMRYARIKRPETPIMDELNQKVAERGDAEE